MSISRENRNKAIFLKRVIDDYTKKVTGEDEERVIGKTPDEQFYVGKLTTDEDINNVNSSRSFINQIGVDFIVKEDELNDIKLKITPSGEYYYRVNPTYDEEVEKLINEYVDIDERKNVTSYEQLIKYFRERNIDVNNLKIDLQSVYKKIRLGDDFSVQLDLKDINYREDKYPFKIYDKVFDEKIEEEIAKKVNIQELYRHLGDKINICNLSSEESWDQYLETRRKEINPSWSFEISAEVKEYSDGMSIVSVYISNTTVGYEKSEKKKKTDRNHITTLFNAGLKVEIDGGEYQAIKSNYFEDDYKYNSDRFAIGNGCGIIHDEKNIIETTNIPIFKQNRLKTRDDLVVRFDDLINKPIDTLNYIYENMEIELRKIQDDYDKKKDKLSEKGIEQFQSEIEQFKFEINRFKNGVNVLESYELMKKAFILMNETFKNSSKGYNSWRLFQIVFIVSLLPDIGVSEYGEEKMGNECRIDEVDVLYFPTGGGKTEAFLGATIFTAFFDRLRGKNSGVTSIIKYPLRLLSVQQVQRVADVLASAELIRRKESSISNSEVFSLGYYVGDVNTPNSLNNRVIEIIKKERQENLNEKYRVMDRCPFCNENQIDIVLDEESYRLKHVCRNKNCKSGGELPIYIVDKEIYRYLPTVIISTIDKIAAIGYQRNFKNILGDVKYKCPVHGYSNKKECTENLICKNKVSGMENITIKDAAPTLLIQDELHLVKESLGAFDSHYETLFQYMLTELSEKNKKIKIIGATATISSYELQLKHLYDKDGIRFPCVSPYLDHNFYSYVDNEEVNRYIIGFAPYSHAIINSVAYSMKYLKEVIWRYKKSPEDILEIAGIDYTSKEEALKILEDYWFLLEYNNVKQDGNKVIGAIQSPINSELRDEQIKEFEYRKMTGDDSFQDVRKVLSEVENTNNVFESFNLIVATSMISHGVDADKFNNIIFFGMPGNTAEYIQAYSRVGRKYPGLVIVLLRPTRERDLSYLKNFNDFHEYKDILVDVVPINRWAKKSIDKTFPGIFQALILNYYDNKICEKYKLGTLYYAKNFKNAIENKYISEDEIKEKLLKAYRCINSNDDVIDLGKQYKKIIEDKVEYLLTELINMEISKDETLSNSINDILGDRVMTSLRDSEEQVVISID